MRTVKNRQAFLLAVLMAPLVFVSSVAAQPSTPTANPGNDGIGMQGTLQQPPPSEAPTISLPVDGTVFEELPITVTGLCTDTLLVRIFKNDVFGGSAICDGGSYQVQIDLFPGPNQLTVRQYDDLDQSSPVSNIVNVTFAIDQPLVPGSPDEIAQRITLTSNFARRGADPGTEFLWPVTISGGRGPYAVSVDWGDGNSDLLTQNSAGTFDLKHVYERPGVYRVAIKATDADGQSAFLQLVGIANGSLGQLADIESGPTVVRTRVLWQPAMIMFPLVLSSFWLGKKYQLKRVRYRMRNRLIPIDK